MAEGRRVSFSVSVAPAMGARPVLLHLVTGLHIPWHELSRLLGRALDTNVRAAAATPQPLLFSRFPSLALTFFFAVYRTPLRNVYFGPSFMTHAYRLLHNYDSPIIWGVP